MYKTDLLLSISSLVVVDIENVIVSPFGAMPPISCVIDNFFPTNSSVKMRFFPPAFSP